MAMTIAVCMQQGVSCPRRITVVNLPSWLTFVHAIQWTIYRRTASLSPPKKIRRQISHQFTVGKPETESCTGSCCGRTLSDVLCLTR
jgi:hypothetical protein